MTFYGDYGFEDYLKVGENIQTNTIISRESADWACTCFATLNLHTDMLFGTNRRNEEHCNQMPEQLLFFLYRRRPSVSTHKERPHHRI